MDKENQPVILVVEENDDNRQLVLKVLGCRGYTVVGVVDGEEALTKLTDVNPDLILMSINLPNMDGYEVIRRIHSRWPETVAIAITEKTAKEESIDGLKHGVSMYLEKPLEMKSVKDAIARGLEQRALKHKAPQI